MIQAWLAKNAVKLGIVGVIMALIFSAGFYVKGKLDDSKIIRLKNQVSVLENNYKHALTQNKTCLENEEALLLEIKKQNNAIDALNRQYVVEKERLHAHYRRLLKDEGVRVGEIQEQYMGALEAFKARISVLSESEACHEAWDSLLEE